MGNRESAESDGEEGGGGDWKGGGIVEGAVLDHKREYREGPRSVGSGRVTHGGRTDRWLSSRKARDIMADDRAEGAALLALMASHRPPLRRSVRTYLCHEGTGREPGVDWGPRLALIARILGLDRP